MFITYLKLDEALDWFYDQENYELMLMYVSSLDYKDKEIMKGISDNASRINRITGEGLCYLYFVDGKYAMNDRNSIWYYGQWAEKNNIKIDLYNAGYDSAINIADDICEHFGILYSDLPAFILINRKDRQIKGVFSISCYEDLELFLTPINIINIYISDRRRISNKYDSEKRKIERRIKEIDDRRLHRESLQLGISRLERRKKKALSSGLDEDANSYDLRIKKLIYQLETHPEITCDKSIGDVDKKFLDDLNHLEMVCSDSLNRALSIHDGRRMINSIGSNIKQRNDIILSIWKQTRTKSIRVSKIVQNIRKQIQEIGYEVFISCKSQDYESAHEVEKYLKKNGFRAFLADFSLPEIGSSEFTAVIGEVLNQCRYLIVFATDVNYLETPYVHEEWTSFLTSIITGRKPDAKIFTILDSNININCIPHWLINFTRFTLDDYKDKLIDFLMHEK